MRARVRERYVHLALINISIIFDINRIGDDQFQAKTDKHLPNGNDPSYQPLALYKDLISFDMAPQVLWTEMPFEILPKFPGSILSQAQCLCPAVSNT
jgi:hypothetical protein